MSEIEIKVGDLTTAQVEAIVNPANSSGSMGGGVAGAIKKAGGEIIEQEAMSKAPIAVGQAVITSAGNLPAAYVIHAPTMEQPTGVTSEAFVQAATLAALTLAKEEGISSLAIPGMGTGVGGLNQTIAAYAIWRAIKAEADFLLKKILLIDIDSQLISTLKEVEKEMLQWG